jgi:DNA-binding NtrC family response regulator
LIQDRLSFEERKRQVAAEDFERILKTPHARAVTSTDGGPDRTINTRRIIVVDDERAICDVIGSILGSEIPNVQLVLAADGIEAGREIEKQKPSLLIMDIVMPRMHGFEVLAEVNRRGWRFPTIVISAYYSSMQEIEKHTNQRLPPLEFMPKPFEVDELVATVKKLLK